ncbi:hypothetical protein [Ferribacterium limneticum]|uniref:hypothetical protein n=1 Tax=Ferribacterium limneticum TaxID=76259 RepID=UPI001CF8CE13|nr:hypothetical protein [Ferribacterium limneticum]UCV22804.1 hypothetical protein KI613_20200 [Ferribacterium limneticum]
MPNPAFVIPAEDICHSGPLALPDALRVVPDIHAAQFDSGRYAKSASGFNGRFASKRQVLITPVVIEPSLLLSARWKI